MQFADIKNDIAFRKIFGNENKKEILISFLNAVLKLEENKKIEWVEILNPYQLPIIIGSKATVLDVKAKDKTGSEYIVEMQVTDHLGFDQRIVYYSAKSYTTQLESGEDYYKLKPVIFIGILDFSFLENENYLSRHLILDAQTYEHKLKDLEFNFIELPKFTKNLEDLESLAEKWVFFIKNADSLKNIPPSLDDEGLQAAYIEADKHLWSKKDLEAYQYAQMRETDEKAKLLLAIQKNNTEIAKKMILAGSDDFFIVQMTNLSIEQVQNLRKID